jgi:hypothetical protein
MDNNDSPFGPAKFKKINYSKLRATFGQFQRDRWEIRERCQKDVTGSLNQPSAYTFVSTVVQSYREDSLRSVFDVKLTKINKVRIVISKER